ncbi:hypothetical protein HPB50_007549 [Hyalomma asiaticum]|uniref:Uncharacterized protein n=1 Tax=Hyalomma asiaticum TaxID=266040 RepID=A0ACB7RJQ2_HYAAI|nr:hypothetical protein HPB50_007549 [Hyalomma asiaticum]
MAVDVTRTHSYSAYDQGSAMVAGSEEHSPAASMGPEIESGHNKCTFCNKAFPQQWRLRRHLRIHTGDRPYKCPFCPMAYNQKCILMGHLRRHTGDKPYECHVYLSSGNVKDEESSTWQEVQANPAAPSESPASPECPTGVASHPQAPVPDAADTDSRRYRCSHCDKSFPRSWHLRRHLRIHTNDRPFACPFCPMTCNQKNNLRSHMRRHTGDKPYRCQQCNMGFSWQSTYAKHVQQHRSEHLPVVIN